MAMDKYYCSECGESFYRDNDSMHEECTCGATARCVINRGLTVFSKGDDFDSSFWNKHKGTNCPNISRHKGINNEQQDRGYQEMHRRAQDAHDHWASNGGKRESDEFELVARTPLEMHESFVEASGGARDAWTRDGDAGVKDKLKRAGVWLAED